MSAADRVRLLLVGRKLGWTPADLGEAAKQSFRASWLPDDVAEKAWFAEIDALVADARAPMRES